MRRFLLGLAVAAILPAAAAAAVVFRPFTNPQVAAKRLAAQTRMFGWRQVTCGPVAADGSKVICLGTYRRLGMMAVFRKVTPHLLQVTVTAPNGNSRTARVHTPLAY